MKIIAGIRPTSSKVKSAIFNILGDKLMDSIFIDLYAGTGAVGMEAMSRGARLVYLVESNKKASMELEKALEGCACKARANVVKKPALNFVKDSIKQGLKADIVFLDPPYYSEELENMLHILSDGSLLAEDGLMIAEHLSKKSLPDEIGSFIKKKTYRYGDTSLTLLRLMR